MGKNGSASRSSSSFGFQKGFLLSSSKRKTTEKKRITIPTNVADQNAASAAATSVTACTTQSSPKPQRRLVTQSSELLQMEHDEDQKHLYHGNRHHDTAQHFLRKAGFLGEPARPSRGGGGEQQRLNNDSDPHQGVAAAAAASSPMLAPFILGQEGDDCHVAYSRRQDNHHHRDVVGGNEGAEFLLAEVGTTVFSHSQCSSPPPPFLPPSPSSPNSTRRQLLAVETAHDSSACHDDSTSTLGKTCAVHVNQESPMVQDKSDDMDDTTNTNTKEAPHHPSASSSFCGYSYWNDQLAVTLTLLKQLQQQRRQRKHSRTKQPLQTSASSWRSVAEPFVGNLVKQSSFNSSQRNPDYLEHPQPPGLLLHLVWESILSEWKTNEQQCLENHTSSSRRRQRRQQERPGSQASASLLQRLALRQLARVLMEQAPWSIIPFLSVHAKSSSSSSTTATIAAISNDDASQLEQNIKQLSLVAIAVVDCVLSVDDDDADISEEALLPATTMDAKLASFPWQTLLVSHIFPALVELVVGNHTDTFTSTSRTVLAQRASDTALAIVALAVQQLVKADSIHTAAIEERDGDQGTTMPSAARLKPNADNTVNDNDNDDSLVQAIWNQSSTLEQLWTAHQGWLLTSDAATTTTSVTTTKTPAVDIRSHCRRAVLDDWRELLQYHRNGSKAASRSINHEQQPCSWDKLCLLNWCRQLNGTFVPWHVIHRDDGCADVDPNVKDHHPITPVGGLQRTLSSTSSILPLVYKDGKLVDGGAQFVLSILEMARELMAVERSNNADDSNQATERRFQIRSLLRAILAWLGQSRKHLDLLLKATNTKGDDRLLLVQLVAEMLHTADERVVVLVLALLDTLWARSAAALDNARNSSSDDEILDCLLNAVNERGAAAKTASVVPLQPASRAIYEFIVRHIFSDHVDKGSLCALLSKVVSKLCISSSVTVSILVMSMKEADSCTNIAHKDDANVSNFVFDLLLEHFHDNDIIQEAMLQDSSIFVRCSTGHVIPKLIQELANLTLGSKENSETSIKISALVASLVDILLENRKPNLQGESMNAVSLIVATLQQLAEDVGSQYIVDNDLEAGFPLDAVCATFTGRWRRALLSCCTDANAFALAMCDIAAEMFKSPSSLVPLALIGSLVGDSNDTDSFPDSVESSVERRQIYIAVIKSCEQCVDEFDRLLDQDDNHVSREKIFARLSPLLLLRRVPLSFFRVARQEAIGSSDSMEASSIIRVFASLGDHIVRRLDETVAQQSFTDEERRLAAEVAGRVLPLGNLIPFDHTPIPCHSLFARVCDPNFKILRDTLNSHDANSTQGFRSTRAALFAVCTLVANSVVSDNGGAELILVAQFCLTILSTRNHEPAAELEKVQAACIEFFSLCLERPLHFFATTLTRVAGNGVANCDRFDGGIRRVNEMVMDVLTSSSSYQADTTSTIQICLWNALIIASKRCRTDVLERFAQATLPSILAWGTAAATSATVAASLEYQLCVAGAMQVVFNVLVRRKSIDILAPLNHDARSTLLQVHRWALSNLRTTAFSQVGVAQNAVRKASLKLVLAVISMGDSPSNCLDYEELVEAYSTLQGVAHLDNDGELRNLATTVLQLLQAA